jgi:hypothetical protein
MSLYFLQLKMEADLESLLRVLFFLQPFSLDYFSSLVVVAEDKCLEVWEEETPWDLVNPKLKFR